MKLDIFSYRFAAEILQHRSHVSAWREITSVIAEAPLYVWPNKSEKKPSLDVLQHLLNSHFDMAFGGLSGWDYHPLATRIADSNLKADFRKVFRPKHSPPLGVQVEVQFGNMARWYSDIFKFQAAYSAELAQVGVCIVPKYDLAKRIDQNIVSFERARRELPSAKLSITLPILLCGVSGDVKTRVIDVSRSRFLSPKEFSYKGKGAANRAKILNGLANGLVIEEIGPETASGPVYEDNVDDTADEGEGGE